MPGQPTQFLDDPQTYWVCGNCKIAIINELSPTAVTGARCSFCTNPMSLVNSSQAQVVGLKLVVQR